MKNTVSIVLIVLIFSCKAEKKGNEINTHLKIQLDSIYHKDQTLRELFDIKTSQERKHVILSEFGYSMMDFERNQWGILIKQDSINLAKIEKIIEDYGSPGKSLVGEPTNESAWYVIQHSNKIKEYFPLIKKAGENGEISKKLVAKMNDRLLTSLGKEQIYGT